MEINYLIAPQDALVSGYDRFAFEITEWGSGIPSFSLPFSVAGVAIGPGSDVVLCDVQLTPTGAKGGGVLPTYRQPVTAELPYIGDVFAPWAPRLLDVNTFLSTYYPIGSNVTAPFGFNMGADPNGTPIFGGRWGSLVESVYPRLILTAFLRPPDNVFPSFTPLYDTGNITLDPGDNVVRVLCVGNRKNIRCVFKLDAAGNCDVAINGAVGGGRPYEFALTTPITMAVLGEEATFDFPLTPDIYWLFIRLKLNAGNPAVRWTLASY